MLTGPYSVSCSRIVLIGLGSILFLHCCAIQASRTNGMVLPKASETAHELVDPPMGEIRKIHLRVVEQCRDTIQKTIEDAPANCKRSHLLVTLGAIKRGLDALAKSRKQTALIDLIPELDDVIRKGPQENETVREYTEDAINWITYLFPPLIHTMAEYLIQQNGEISGDKLSKFVTVFSTEGFLREPDWEDNPIIPIWSSDLFVANPDGVINDLKSRPWRITQGFIGGNDMKAAQFLGRYSSPNSPLSELLLPKYIKNREVLFIKFKKLKHWMLQQQKREQNRRIAK